MNWGSVAEYTKKIFSVQAEPTDSDLQQKPKSAEMHDITGTINSRNGSIIIVDEDTADERRINLDKVEVDDDYIPRVGDVVRMQAEAEDEEEELMTVVYIEPNQKVQGRGKVTMFNNQVGLIDGKYIFHKEILDDLYTPKIRETVSYTAIESEQEYDDNSYDFRCIQVVPIEDDKENKVQGNVGKPVQDNQMHRNKRQWNNKNRNEQKPALAKLETETLEIDFRAVGETKIGSFQIESISDKPCTLKKIRLFGKADIFTCELQEPFKPIELQPTEKLEFQVEVKAEKNGSSEQRINFLFDEFILKGKIFVNVLDVKKPVKIKNNRYYTQLILKELNRKDFIPGEKMHAAPRFIARRFGSYPVPPELTEIVLKQSSNFGEVMEKLGELVPVLANELSPSCYVEKFHILLYLEEIESLHQLRCYDQDRVQFYEEDGFLAMKIENLAERKPSICIGDRLIASSPTEIVEAKTESDETKNSKVCESEFEGCIHQVRKDRILLKFNPRFHEAYNGESWKVVFEFSRTNFRKQHEALERSFQALTTDVFFPSQIVPLPFRYNVKLKNNELYCDKFEKPHSWFNPKLNDIQKQAVINVLKGEARPLPYVIYGPPGTGKTITLIEIILQISRIDENARILVGTPSNSASNLLTEQLVAYNSIPKEKFLRIVSYNLVEKEMVPDHLKPYCGTIEVGEERSLLKEEEKMVKGVRHRIPFSKLKTMNVIIGTCSCLGSLMSHDFIKTHFTHVIIDEAGQLLEPETMMPASLLDKEVGQLILAGDPQQLGPVVFSPYSKELGLRKSYLERLLELPFYKKNDDDEFNERVVTQLIYNYRSLPSVLTIYNILFYDNALESMISEDDSTPEMKCLKSVQDVIEKLSDSYHPEKVSKYGLPASKVGVHFVPVRGMCEQSDYSPSWFNTTEARQICSFALQLFEIGVKPHEIGIITPYIMQVRTIREFFEKHKMNRNMIPRIGTVEDFQGQERNIILVSTVRASEDRLKFDKRYTLGFVKESKRMNVTISRAKSLLVVFGCERILITDEKWKELISYTIINNTFHGDTDYVLKNI